MLKASELAVLLLGQNKRSLYLGYSLSSLTHAEPEFEARLHDMVT